MVEAPHTGWPIRFNETIVPETFVEITLGVVDTAAIANSLVYVAEDYNKDPTGYTSRILGTSETVNAQNYATLEENLWTLDGSKVLRYYDSSQDTGYVGKHNASVNHCVEILLPDVAEVTIPGFVIVWSNDHEEYPTEYGITFTNSKTGGVLVLGVRDSKWSVIFPNGIETDVNALDLDNSTPHITRISGDFTGFDNMRIDIGAWNTPNHRKRLDRVILGYNWTFGKNEIVSFSHEQTADPITAELPKNSITFSLDNSQDLWNPSNPKGFAKYVTERQMVTVRYGMDVNKNGHPYWIPGGVFYLSEWDIPSNGLEATFTARDAIEFMLDVPYSGIASGSPWEIIQSALSLCDFPNKIKVATAGGQSYPIAMGNHSQPKNGVYDCSVAEVIQMCANVMGVVCWFDRDGTLRLVRTPWNRTPDKVFDIPLDLAYSYPELSLSKPIKGITVSYLTSDFETGYHYVDFGQYTHGEILRIDNLLIPHATCAANLCSVAKVSLNHRELMTGEYRADPRLDVFDLVNVSDKYGDTLMILTRIKYIYTGVFRGEYTARKITISKYAGIDWSEEVEI